MSWNILKKRRSYLERGGQGPQTSGTGEPTSNVAKSRYDDLAAADKLDSGPFYSPDTEKGPFGPSEVAPEALPTPRPTPTPTELADYHENEAEKHKPKDIPSEGKRNLTPDEKKELDPYINMQPRR